MAALKALFIGGTGRISAHCVDTSIARGFDTYVLNRGQNAMRPHAGTATYLVGDARNPASVAEAVKGMEFDVVVNFVAYTAADVEADLEIFGGRMGQYVFISSASAYQTPPARLPITESTPLHNPIWKYSQDKIAAELVLNRAYIDDSVPITIIRPSHTYDCGAIPLIGQWTSVERMRAGKPVIVHGDGSSLWTVTHSRDFAKAFGGIMANPRAYGQSFHITSDEAFTWETITRMIGKAAGVDNPDIVHVASDAIAAVDPVWGAAMLGDMTHSLVFDNSKIKALVPDFVCTTPFHVGIRESIAWFDANPQYKIIDRDKDEAMDWLADNYRPKARPARPA